MSILNSIQNWWESLDKKAPPEPVERVRWSELHKDEKQPKSEEPEEDPFTAKPFPREAVPSMCLFLAPGRNKLQVVGKVGDREGKELTKQHMGELAKRGACLEMITNVGADVYWRQQSDQSSLKLIRYYGLQCSDIRPPKIERHLVKTPKECGTWLVVRLDASEEDPAIYDPIVR